MRFGAALSVTCFLAAPVAHALPDLQPGSDLSKVTEPAVVALIDTIGFSLDHRAFMPATPLGVVGGVDVGMDITAVSRPTRFVDAAREAGVVARIPAVFYFPRLNVHKGLPFGIDIGCSYLKYHASYIGGLEIKWPVLMPSAVTPAVGLRLSKNWLNVFFMKIQTIKLDLVASKRVTPFLDPYAGVGMQWVSGSLDVPVGGTTGLVVRGDHSHAAPHVYTGLPVRLFLSRIVLEYDYSFVGLSTFGAKISFAIAGS